MATLLITGALVEQYVKEASGDYDASARLTFVDLDNGDKWEFSTDGFVLAEKDLKVLLKKPLQWRIEGIQVKSYRDKTGVQRSFNRCSMVSVDQVKAPNGAAVPA